MADKAILRSINDGRLKGITAIEIPACVRTSEDSDQTTMVMVPYYAWANRGKGSMNVWFGANRDLAV